MVRFVRIRFKEMKFADILKLEEKADFENTLKFRYELNTLKT